MIVYTHTNDPGNNTPTWCMIQVKERKGFIKKSGILNGSRTLTLIDLDYMQIGTLDRDHKSLGVVN
jgi:hypothetical protein